MSDDGEHKKTHHPLETNSSLSSSFAHTADKEKEKEENFGNETPYQSIFHQSVSSDVSLQHKPPENLNVSFMPTLLKQSTTLADSASVLEASTTRSTMLNNPNSMYLFNNAKNSLYQPYSIYNNQTTIAAALPTNANAPNGGYENNNDFSGSITSEMTYSTIANQQEALVQKAFEERDKANEYLSFPYSKNINWNLKNPFSQTQYFAEANRNDSETKPFIENNIPVIY